MENLTQWQAHNQSEIVLNKYKPENLLVLGEIVMSFFH